MNASPAERARLIEQYKDLVWHLAIKQFNRNDQGRRLGEVGDLAQEGFIGLNRAIDKFDPGRGVKFITFACTCITRAMKDACLGPMDGDTFKRQPGMISVPRYAYAEAHTREDAARAIDVGYLAEGFDLAEERSPEPDSEELDALRRAIGKLKGRPRKVITGVLAGEPLTVIAGRLGVTRQCVWIHYDLALQILRHHMGARSEQSKPAAGRASRSVTRIPRRRTPTATGAA